MSWGSSFEAECLPTCVRLWLPLSPPCPGDRAVGVKAPCPWPVERGRVSLLPQAEGEEPPLERLTLSHQPVLPQPEEKEEESSNGLRVCTGQQGCVTAGTQSTVPRRPLCAAEPPSSSEICKTALSVYMR